MPTIDRHIFVEREPSLNAMTLRINGSQSLVDYKALVFRSGEPPSTKVVGVFAAGSRFGQGIQAAGSVAVPGDYSNIRSPVRSRLYAAVTPGGGGGRNIPGVRKPTRGYRCPEGYQFGGRFTDSRYSTCGRKLFDIADLGETIARLLGITSIGRATGRGPGTQASGEVIRGGQVSTSTVISRAPEIPRVGNFNRSRMAQVIEGASSTLTGQPDGSSYLIRRDGYALKPVVPASILRTVPDNRNMEGAAYLVSASKPDSIGKDELGLLSNTGVSSLQYVLPNGSKLKLDKVRELTVGERRKLGRTVNEAASMDVRNDPSARLKAVATNSNGGIKYSEEFKNIDKPNDLVTSGSTSVRRWVAESFKPTGKKPTLQQVEETAEDSSKLTDKITNAQKAIKHLDENGDVADISPSVLHEAMSKTKAFTTTKLVNGFTLHERADGKAYFEVTKPDTYEHIGARVSSDIQRQLGLKAPAVTFVGSGVKRQYLLEHPRNAVGERSIRGDTPLADAPSQDMMRLAVADWLVDERNRTPGNIAIFKMSAGDGAMATSNRSAGLSGLAKTELSARQKLKMDEMFADARRGVYGSAFEKLSASQRRLIIKQLEEIIKKADTFNWDEYMSRLMIDGELSDSEKAHLRLVQSMYQNRLEMLRGSKEQFLKIIGAQ